MSASAPQGLSTAEAERRLREDGPNSLSPGHDHLFAMLLGIVREPMFLLLMTAASLYLLLGSLHEGLLLVAMVAITIGVTLFQEGKTERALQALRDMSSPHALVMRDGRPQRIPGSSVVKGDMLLVGEGDRIAADAVLLQANGLRVDESVLTGEAWAVGKQVAPGAPGSVSASGAPGGEDLPFLWSGTMVVQGDGLARVTATGAGTEIGKIGRSLAAVKLEQSPLQRQTGRMVRQLALGGVMVSLLVVVLYGIQRGAWMPALLAGIALSMSLLPEEFPVIMAVFPAIGAWRMSHAQVLTRRLASIEALGTITVLCSDKTGTLTENRMRVEQLHAGGKLLQLLPGRVALPAPYAELARFASLASKQRAVDPMEQAFHALAGQQVAGEPLREYALSAALRAMSLAWPNERGGATIATKGAPEDIAALCRLGRQELNTMRRAVDDMAAQGLRVLAVAGAQHEATALPATQSEFPLHYLGLVGLADPLREEVPDAIGQCHGAGIRVVMITGDYPGTAASIAKRAGLPCDSVLSGEALEQMDDETLRQHMRQATVCARITPTQKLRIVQALKANGEIVAMTGDGVNDAPALKAAHVGIAMGGRGADVAREAAALVLMDDNFASIVRGIRLGRRIFANMRNAMAYVMCIHVPIAGMALLPALFGWPILLYPMHIAFLELIIDPACSLAFENEASDEEAMRQAPRPADAPLLDRLTVVRALLQGSIALAIVAVAYVWALSSMAPGAARAAGFAVLVMANLALIFSNLSRRRSAMAGLYSANAIPRIVALAALAMLLVTLYVPFIAAAFQFEALTAAQWAIVLVFGVASMVGYELVKYAALRSLSSRGTSSCAR